jgi:hypothetical protein
MSFNLIDYVNGIFKGLVGFFYSFGSAVCLLTFRPFRGALQQARRATSQRDYQIDARAFLFISTLIWIMSLDVIADVQEYAIPDITTREDRTSFKATLSAIPHYEYIKLSRAFSSAGVVVLHFVAPAVLIVVILQAFAKLVALAVIGARFELKRERWLFAEMTLYNIGYIGIGTALLLVLLVLLSADTEAYLQFAIFALACVCLAGFRLLPITVAFLRNRRPRYTKFPVLRAIARYALASVVSLSALGVYFYFGFKLPGLSSIDPVPRGLTLTKVECYMVGTDPVHFRGLAVLTNETNEPMIVRSDDFAIGLVKNDYYSSGGSASIPENSEAIIIKSSFGSIQDAYTVFVGTTAWFYIESEGNAKLESFYRSGNKRAWNDKTDRCFVYSSKHRAIFDGQMQTDYKGAISNTQDGPLVPLK